VVRRVGDGNPESLASVDGRWEGSRPALVAAIRDEILASREQCITFARFMERALTEPDLGYYATSKLRPTREGDFLTAPELHPFFGRCVGRFLTSAWLAAGSPERYLVREHGAGRGTLRDTVLAGLAADGSGLSRPIEWDSVDLPRRGDCATGAADVVLANEYLDALPVHRPVQAGGLREAFVVWREGWFVEKLSEPSSPDLAAPLGAAGVAPRRGQRAAVCRPPPRWLVAAAMSLAPGGLLLVIDYGHEAPELYGPRRLAGSLLTYREHRVAQDPFMGVGNSDLTSHVDITALHRAARSAGLEALGDTSQAAFLAGLGLGELLSALGREPGTEPEAYLLARSAVARFLDPRHLGAFRVLLWGRPRADAAARVLPGFEAASAGRP
jgi:SAM-dependent MidA family methyltransferase